MSVHQSDSLGQPTARVAREPRAIREALVASSDRDMFEAEYQGALDEARRSYSLRNLDLVVERWWRFVNLADGHAVTLEVAERVRSRGDLQVIDVDFAKLQG